MWADVVKPWRIIFGQGVGPFYLAAAVAPFPVVLIYYGFNLYLDEQAHRMAEVLDSMSQEHLPTRVNPNWAVEAYALRNVDRVPRNVPPLAQRFWEVFFSHGTDLVPIDVGPCAGSPLLTRAPQSSYRPAACATVTSGSPPDTLWYVPPEGVVPASVGQPGAAAPPTIELTANAESDAQWRSAFLEAAAVLTAAGDNTDGIVQAYVVGAGGSTGLWSKESAWVAGLRAAPANDAHSGAYYTQLFADWSRWYSEGHPPSPDFAIDPAILPVAITAITPRYDDMLGAGLVWTACVANVGDGTERTGAPWGQWLGAVCVDIADLQDAIKDLKDGAERPIGSRDVPVAPRAQPALDLSESRWWNIGLLTYDNSEQGAVLYLAKLSPAQRGAAAADSVAAIKKQTARKDIVLKVERSGEVREKTFLLPIGTYGQTSSYLYLEQVPETLFGAGVAETALGGLLLLGVSGAWAVGWNKKRSVEGKKRTSILLDYLQVGVILADENDNIVFANDRAEEIVGRPLTRLSPAERPNLNALFEPVVLVPDEGWRTLNDAAGTFRGRTSTLAEVLEQRRRGQSSRYYARLSAKVLIEADAPRYANHPLWCPWVEIIGSPRLDRSRRDSSSGEPEDSYGVLRQMSPQIGWGLLEPFWQLNKDRCDGSGGPGARGADARRGSDADASGDPEQTEAS